MTEWVEGTEDLRKRRNRVLEKYGLDEDVRTLMDAVMVIEIKTEVEEYRVGSLLFGKPAQQREIRAVFFPDGHEARVTMKQIEIQLPAKLPDSEQEDQDG
jgi:hypothetical protein